MVPYELPIDAVGLWQIMAAGRGGFELSGTELVEFVRLVLLALFEKGGQAGYRRNRWNPRLVSRAVRRDAI